MSLSLRLCVCACSTSKISYLFTHKKTATWAEKSRLFPLNCSDFKLVTIIIRQFDNVSRSICAHSAICERDFLLLLLFFLHPSHHRSLGDALFSLTFGFSACFNVLLHLTVSRQPSLSCPYLRCIGTTLTMEKPLALSKTAIWTLVFFSLSPIPSWNLSIVFHNTPSEKKIYIKIGWAAKHYLYYRKKRWMWKLFSKLDISHNLHFQWLKDDFHVP